MTSPPGIGPTDPLAQLAALPPTEFVTSLRVLGEGVELPLDRAREQWTIGSAPPPATDLHLPATSVSRRHALIQRDGNRLRVKDEGSTNGTTLHGRQEAAFHVAAGQPFKLADKVLLPMGDLMRGLLPHLEWSLGFDQHDRVDRALREIVEISQPPILLLGKSGCDQEPLAQAFHAFSARHDRPFVEVPAIRDRAEENRLLAMAARGSVFVDLRMMSRMSAYFVGQLFEDTHQLRCIFSSPDRAEAERLLGRYASRLRDVHLPTLEERSQDVPQLLNTLLAELGCKKTVEHLSADNVKALVAHTWTDNIDGLRRVAPKLAALLETGTIEGAATVLGISHQAVSRTFRGLGLKLRRNGVAE